MNGSKYVFKKDNEGYFTDKDGKTGPFEYKIQGDYLEINTDKFDENCEILTKEDKTRTDNLTPWWKYAKGKYKIEKLSGNELQLRKNSADNYFLKFKKD